MDQRLKLHELLISILGSNNVYFQPPSNVQMRYPAIVYKREALNTAFANNNIYRYKKRYMVSIIDRDPDSLIPDKMLQIPYCGFSKHYVVDGLNHDVFTLYF